MKRPIHEQRAIVRKVRSWLSRRFSVPFPLSIRMQEDNAMQDALGMFWLDDDHSHGTIWLRSNVTDDVLVETLLEEWAHARTSLLIDTEDKDDDPFHHASFWAEYGRLVKAYRTLSWD